MLKHDSAYRPYDEHYEVLFNSYYNTVGEQFPRDQRGLLSRPSLEETLAYRDYVDAAVVARLEAALCDDEFLQIVELGIQHEQQHQELILTDVKHLFAKNPLFPVFREGRQHSPLTQDRTVQWFSCDGGIHEIGHDGEGFSFDNEGPRHRVLLEDHQLSSLPVSSSDYAEFINDGGYSRPELWLALGWDWRQREGWTQPLYWFKVDGQWHEFTLAGMRPLDPVAPVTHVSYFEADAYARWADARLPTEAEWEVASRQVSTEGNFADTLIEEEIALHPSCIASVGPSKLVEQMFGDVWEWTSSSYSPYPGYCPPAGALGEYNGKFMCNQYVLRGGSVATSSTHIRATYRNFFSPESRWQFSGVRLAK